MFHWLRQNLFQNALNSIISVTLAGFTLFWLSMFIEWALINSVWRASSLAECQTIIVASRGQGASGACWAVFGHSFNSFVFGFYPTDLYWRPMIVAAFAAVILMAALSDRFFRQFTFMALIYPVISIWLIRGGFGLEHVETARLGGFILMLIVVAYSGPVALTAGFLLALCRRFLILPARAMAAAFIQFFDAIPPIVLIFAGVIFSNYLLAPGTFIDFFTLIACLIGLASAAPVARIFSYCLAQIPEGQIDAARALGFSDRRAFWLVIMPQVIMNAAPQFTMIIAKLVRDTTLLIVVGLLDPVGLISVLRANAAWNGIVWELFLAIAGVYWIFSFAITMLGERLQQKLMRRAGTDTAGVLKATGMPVVSS